MSNTSKRLIALLLCAAMMVALCPAHAAAAEGEVIAYQPTNQSITLRAEAENTITVNQKELEDRDGILDIEAGFFTIERDYEQSCMIQVSNDSEQMVEFYLEASNDYSDISLEIIRAGSDESPIAIEPGETMSIELSVFAQNAANEEYRIPVTAYVANGGEYVADAMSEALLTCLLPALEMEWTLVSEESSTLRQTWEITNVGDAITDLVMYATGDAADYLKFTPVISNLAVAVGETVEFTVQPDLAKMKAGGITALSGKLAAASAGKVSTADCLFDTKGEEITVTTMGKLALQQSGNAYLNFECIPESIRLCYFNGTEYVDAADESLSDILDENREFEMVLSGEIDLGIEVPLEVKGTFSSQILAEPDPELVEDVTIETDENGNLVIVATDIMSMEEYEQFIANEAAPVALMAAASDEEEEEEKDAVAVTQEVWEAGLKDVVSDEGQDIVEKGFKAHDAWEAYSNVQEAANDPTLSDRYQKLNGGAAVLKELKDAAFETLGNSPLIGDYFKATNDGWDNAFDGLMDHIKRQDSYSKLLGDYDDILDEVLSPEEEYEKYAEEHENKGYADVTTSFSGSQCTNRGKLEASSYVPNYTGVNQSSMFRVARSGESNGMLLFATSRMYGKGYVNREETNYNILLNGFSAGETHSAGITEIAIAQLSTEHLLLGEVNSITWDYDTDPGTHFVTTENDLHILFPLDTEIGYIGTPEELEDVRLLPDAVIYAENIFVDGDAVVGCPAKLSFNAYNIGSRGGWFNIIVRDGEDVIYMEENHHIHAFTGEKFEIDWTPAAETNEISVELVHTSLHLEEKDSTNNMAAVSLTARHRQVPYISSAYSDTVYADAPFTLSAYIGDYNDVTDVVFYVDGVALEGQPKSSVMSGKARYWQTCPDGMAVGSYTAAVEVTYAISPEETETIRSEFLLEVLEPYIPVPTAVFDMEGFLGYGETIKFTVYDADVMTRAEVSVDGGDFAVLEPTRDYGYEKRYELATDSWAAGSHTIVLNMYYQGADGEEMVAEELAVTMRSEEESRFCFSVDDTVGEFQIKLYNEYGSSQSFESGTLDDGTYWVKKTADMCSYPEKYTLAVITDNAFITKTLDQTDAVFSINDCSKVTLIGSEVLYISYLDIENVGSMNIPDQKLHSYDTIYLSPNTYKLYMTLEFGTYSASSRVDVDVTGGDQTIYLEDLVLNYQFQIENAVRTSYKASLYYRYSGSTYWYSTSISASFSPATGTLYCMSNSTYTMDYLNRAEEAYIVIYSADEVFVTQVKAPEEAQGMTSGTYTLNRDDLIPVSLVCEESGLSVSSVKVYGEFYEVILNASTIYLPAGAYDFVFTVSTGSQTMVSEASAVVDGACEVIADSGIRDNLTDLVVSWDARFNELADLEADTEDDLQIYANQVASGYEMKVEAGYRDIYINVYQDSNRFYFNKTLYAQSGEDAYMNISADWTAEITRSFGSVNAGAELYAPLNNIMDSNGNYLYSWSVSSRTPLCGNVHFTDVDDESHVITVPITTTSRYLYVDAPMEPGTYTMSVELFTNAVAVDNSHTHTEVTDPAVAATCTTDGLTEGKHCSECGVVLVAQEVIPAAGHSFRYEDQGDGTHLTACDNCDHAAAEPHTFTDGSCTACGAAEHIHIYGEPVFTWTEDHSACSAAFTCAECGDVQTLACEITAVTIPADCTEDGVIEYTAAVEFDGLTYSDYREEVLSATGHSYVDGVCEHCGEAEKVPQVPAVPVKPWWMILLERLIGWLCDWCSHDYMEHLCPFCG